MKSFHYVAFEENYLKKKTIYDLFDQFTFQTSKMKCNRKSRTIMAPLWRHYPGLIIITVNFKRELGTLAT